MGVTRTKPTNPLHDIQIAHLQGAVDWMKRHIAARGYVVLSAQLDPDAGMWRFDVGGAMINVPHALVRRAQDALDWMAADGA